ncbi:hypothetical protein [Mucilaginibacter aquaedulcis]|uniref:hypothetical protein n=1 Tax=Mucilaginibacter aquaedulcis TaxID=1187081 RepID=UPI0025B2A402|nr:hypothetical protein [Mucilaginibacter aquaedulcis]MDN3548964.1 hypothetical protein [Mucilaginibacter aquaedulcis]
MQPKVEVFQRTRIRLLCINKRQLICPFSNNKSNQTMNHLLHQISWHQYLSFAILAAIIYYALLILRCYQPELRNLQRRISGEKPGEDLQALQFQPGQESAIAEPVIERTEKPYTEEAIADTDLLAGKLKACIIRAADQPFAPAVLILQLQQVLQDHQYIAAADRPLINRLIVNECDKTGTALLTEEEVDQWWER